MIIKRWKIHERPAFRDDFLEGSYLFLDVYLTAGVGREGGERGLDFEGPTGEETTTVAVAEGWGMWHCHTTASLRGSSR